MNEKTPSLAARRFWSRCLSGTTTFMDYVTIRYVDGAPFPEYTPPPPAQPQTVNVSTVTLSQGKIVSGGAANLKTSDNSYLVLQPATRTKPVQVVFDGSTTTAPSALSYVMEAGVTQVNISVAIELFNFKTNSYEKIVNGSASIGDVHYGTTLSGDVTRFINSGTNALRARVTFTPGTGTPNWKASIDQFNWYVTP